MLLTTVITKPLDDSWFTHTDMVPIKRKIRRRTITELDDMISLPLFNDGPAKLVSVADEVFSVDAAWLTNGSSGCWRFFSSMNEDAVLMK